MCRWNTDIGQGLPGQRGNVRQRAVVVETPAVIRALDLPLAHFACRQRRIAVRAAVLQRAVLAVAGGKHHIGLAKQGNALRAAAHIALTRGDIPVIVQKVGHGGFVFRQHIVLC